MAKFASAKFTLGKNFNELSISDFGNGMVDYQQVMVAKFKELTAGGTVLPFSPQSDRLSFGISAPSDKMKKFMGVDEQSNVLGWLATTTQVSPRIQMQLNSWE